MPLLLAKYATTCVRPPPVSIHTTATIPPISTTASSAPTAVLAFPKWLTVHPLGPGPALPRRAPAAQSAPVAVGMDAFGPGGRQRRGPGRRSAGRRRGRRFPIRVAPRPRQRHGTALMVIGVARDGIGQRQSRVSALACARVRRRQRRCRRLADLGIRSSEGGKRVRIQPEVGERRIDERLYELPG